MTLDHDQQSIEPEPAGYSPDGDHSLGTVGGKGSRRRRSHHRRSHRRGSRHRSHRGGMCGISHTGGRKRRKSKSCKHPKKNHTKSRTRRRRSHRV